jgi:hypothetical protein
VTACSLSKTFGAGLEKQSLFMQLAHDLEMRWLERVRHLYPRVASGCFQDGSRLAPGVRPHDTRQAPGWLQASSRMGPGWFQVDPGGPRIAPGLLQDSRQTKSGSRLASGSIFGQYKMITFLPIRRLFWDHEKWKSLWDHEKWKSFSDHEKWKTIYS